MSDTLWLAAGLGVGSMVMKASGPVALGGRPLPSMLSRLLTLAGPVLLAALAASLTFAADRSLVIDARLGGIVVALVGLVLRWPLLLTVVVAGLGTALLRAAGIGA